MSAWVHKRTHEWHLPFMANRVSGLGVRGRRGGLVDVGLGSEGRLPG